MTEDQPHDLLNDNQRRALSARMAMLDRFFSDIEQLLDAGARPGEMFEVIIDLTDDQKAKVLTLLKEGHREIRASRDEFNLEPKREYLHRMMAGHLSIFWTILEDCRAAKLEGFGGVSPRLAAELDPKIEALIDIVNSLKSIVIR
jgi:hypothetical protein